MRRDQVAAADLSRQAQQIQSVARETHSEARRLAAAIDTLNSDRDRLYSRVTGLEQGLDSVTGAIARQGPAAASPPPAHAGTASRPKPLPQPAVAPVAHRAAPPTNPWPPRSPPRRRFTPPPRMPRRPTPPRRRAPGWKRQRRNCRRSNRQRLKWPRSKYKAMAKTDLANDTAKPEPAKPSPATPLMAVPSMMAPPDPAASKLIEPGKALEPCHREPDPRRRGVGGGTDAEADETTAPKVSLQRTEFGVDLGTANSVNGLRALWRGLLKSRSNAPLTALRPIIVIKENTNGLGMQLRLVAGPLHDAGAAARICAVLTENKRPCETTIYEGQRLSLKSDDLPPIAAKPGRPGAPSPSGRRRRGGREKAGSAAGDNTGDIVDLLQPANDAIGL